MKVNGTDDKAKFTNGYLGAERMSEHSMRCYTTKVVLISFVFLFLFSMKYKPRINLVTNLPIEPLFNLLECVKVSIYNGNLNLIKNLIQFIDHLFKSLLWFVSKMMMKWCQKPYNLTGAGIETVSRKS